MPTEAPCEIWGWWDDDTAGWRFSDQIPKDIPRERLVAYVYGGVPSKEWYAAILARPLSPEQRADDDPD